MEPNDQGLSGDQITNLVSSDESQSLAFESELSDRSQAAELIAEMANSGGGTILVGVEEPRKPVGLDDPAEATQVAKEAAKTISPAVEVTVNEVEVEGLMVAAVEVPPAGQEPVLPPKGPIVKRDAAGKTEAVSGEDVMQALTRGGKTTEQALAELNDRFVKKVEEDKRARRKLAKDLDAAIKKGPTLSAQLPGMLISALVGAVFGAVLTAAIGL